MAGRNRAPRCQYVVLAPDRCLRAKICTLIQIKIASWEVGEAARVEDLQRWIKEALGNASVAATKQGAILSNNSNLFKVK